MVRMIKISFYIYRKDAVQNNIFRQLKLTVRKLVSVKWANSVCRCAGCSFHRWVVCTLNADSHYLVLTLAHWVNLGFIGWLPLASMTTESVAAIDHRSAACDWLLPWDGRKTLRSTNTQSGLTYSFFSFLLVPNLPNTLLILLPLLVFPSHPPSLSTSGSGCS